MGLSMFQVLVILAVVTALVGVAALRRRGQDRALIRGGPFVPWLGDPKMRGSAGHDEPVGVLECIALLGVLVLIAVIVWSVLSRYLFNNVSVLADALIFEAGGVVFALSVAAAVRRGALHSLGAPRRRDCPPGLGALDIGLTSFALGLSAWFLVGRLLDSIQFREESYFSVLPIPMAPIIGAVLASLFLAALAGFRRLLLREDDS